MKILKGKARHTRDRHAPITRLLYGKKDAAEILGVSVRTVEALYYAGRLLAVRIRRRVLFHRDTLEEFARRGCAG
jgi:excisionase family DNA binding protein